MKPFTTIAAAVFTAVALVHLYRIFAGFPITIGGTSVGAEVSWIGLIVAGVLAFGLFKEARR